MCKKLVSFNSVPTVVVEAFTRRHSHLEMGPKPRSLFHICLLRGIRFACYGFCSNHVEVVVVALQNCFLLSCNKLPGRFLNFHLRFYSDCVCNKSGQSMQKACMSEHPTIKLCFEHLL